MLIDCDTCQVRGPACGDCVVTVLLSAPPLSASHPAGAGVEFDEAEAGALEVLAEHGLVPPLRLAAAPDPAVTATDRRPAARRSDHPHAM